MTTATCDMPYAIRGGVGHELGWSVTCNRVTSRGGYITCNRLCNLLQNKCNLGLTRTGYRECNLWWRLHNL